MTLQFSAAGSKNARHQKSMKKAPNQIDEASSSDEMSYLAAALSAEEFKDVTPKKPKASTLKKAKTKEGYETHTKDLQLSIFHALGKFLYNKRINPQTKEIKQLPYKMMKDPNKRPKLYFRPQEILD